LQEIPPSDPVDQGDEGDWETMADLAERSRSPAPAMTEVEPQEPVAESRTEPVAAPATEEPAATEAVEEAPAEAGLIDIASCWGIQETRHPPNVEFNEVREICFSRAKHSR
jgi:hypothetical protein